VLQDEFHSKKVDKQFNYHSKFEFTKELYNNEYHPFVNLYHFIPLFKSTRNYNISEDPFTHNIHVDKLNNVVETLYSHNKMVSGNI